MAKNVWDMDDDEADEYWDGQAACQRGVPLPQPNEPQPSAFFLQGYREEEQRQAQQREDDLHAEGRVMAYELGRGQEYDDGTYSIDDVLDDYRRKVSDRLHADPTGFLGDNPRAETVHGYDDGDDDYGYGGRSDYRDPPMHNPNRDYYPAPRQEYVEPPKIERKANEPSPRQKTQLCAASDAVFGGLGSKSFNFKIDVADMGPKKAGEKKRFGAVSRLASSKNKEFLRVSNAGTAQQTAKIAWHVARIMGRSTVAEHDGIKAVFHPGKPQNRFKPGHYKYQ